MSAARGRTKPAVQNRAGRELTEEEFAQVLANDRIRSLVFLVLAIFVGMAILALAATPMAKAIAGTTTHFDVQISLVFSFTLAVTTAIGGAGCYQLNKARVRHRNRARRLEKQLAKAQESALPESKASGQ